MFRLLVWRASLFLACFGCIHFAGQSTTCAQEPIFSFEDGLQPWTALNATIVQSTFGATHGQSALLIDDLTKNYKDNIGTTNNFGPATAGMTDAYNAFNQAAHVIANGGTPKLEFDFSWDFSQVTTSNWLQFGMVINSQAGWKEYNVGQFIEGNADVSSSSPLALDSLAVNDGVTFTSIGPSSAHVAIPFGPTKTITISPDSTYYYIKFKSNGGWDGTVDFAIDNIKFTGVPIFQEHTLFSWETPDDAGTPGINEQLEGWGPNPAVTPPTQNLSITTTGATDGNFALQLDRTPLPSGFTWGSVFGLDANVDPSVQTQIDDFVSRINGATKIEIDITYQDQFPISPTYTHLSLAFVDESGAYYQASTSSFNINNAPAGTQRTLVLDIADFDDANSSKNLAVDGLMTGTSQFGIVLGTGTDGGAIYQIDNFRLLTEVVDEPSADFDNDGDVDGRDFLSWQRGGSPNPLSAEDLALWQEQYGTTPPFAAITAVPEPTSVALLAIAGGFALASFRRSFCLLY